MMRPEKTSWHRNRADAEMRVCVWNTSRTSFRAIKGGMTTIRNMCHLIIKTETIFKAYPCIYPVFFYPPFNESLSEHSEHVEFLFFKQRLQYIIRSENRTIKNSCMRVLLLKPHQGESSAMPDGVQLVKFVVSRSHCVYTRVDSNRERKLTADTRVER